MQKRGWQQGARFNQSETPADYIPDGQLLHHGLELRRNASRRMQRHLAKENCRAALRELTFSHPCRALRIRSPHPSTQV